MYGDMALTQRAWIICETRVPELATGESGLQAQKDVIQDKNACEVWCSLQHI